MIELKAFNSERIYWAVEQVERAAGDIDTLHLDDNLFYIKSEVDAAIEELKDENRMLKRALWLARAKRATEKADSFIDIKVTYCGVCNINNSVYPEKNARRMLTCDEWLDVWTNVWEKCLNKAEEYK